jgi:hypothetical protein
MLQPYWQHLCNSVLLMIVLCRLDDFKPQVEACALLRC